MLDPATGTWSLFVSQFSHSCPLAFWKRNSMVVRAESTNGAAGPYYFAEEIYPEFHHNPTIVGPTMDGFYLIFMIGQTNASNVLDCKRHPLPVPADGLRGPEGTILMGYSHSLRGPWSEPRVVLRNYNPAQNQSDWDCYVTNPSVNLLPDGTVMLVFSSVPCAGGFDEALGVAFAPHWNATYTKEHAAIWRKPGPRQSPVSDGVGNVEDPFTWVDARGRFHIVAHSQGARNVCGGGVLGNSCGVHFYSESALGPWEASLTPVYSSAMPLTNGSMARMMTRQRPQIVFAADGTTPKYMFVGGSLDEYNRGTTSLERTFVFEFNQQPPDAVVDEYLQV